MVFGEGRLRQILRKYAQYYKTTRTRLSLDKDMPDRRPIQYVGRVVSLPLLNGLHHQYARIWLSVGKVFDTQVFIIGMRGSRFSVHTASERARLAHDERVRDLVRGGNPDAFRLQIFEDCILPVLAAEA